MDQYKIRTYLFYAVGEVRMAKIARELLTDIEKTSIIMNLTDALYQRIKEGRANNTDIRLRIPTTYLTDTPMLFPKLSAYKSIQAFGVNIISNDSLRKSMTDLFELRMERVTLTESYLYELDKSAFRPYFRSYSKPGNDCLDCLSLKDQFGSFDRTKQNMFVLDNPQDDFLHMLKDKYNIMRALEGRYGSLNQQIEEMLNIINEEIKTSND